MSVMARLKIVILGWAAVAVFFTAVLEVSDFGHKPLGFALYSNAVQFALWALALPLLVKFIRRFPLKDSKTIRNAGVLLILIAVIGMLVAVIHLAIMFPTYFPEHSSYPTFQDLIRSELVRFLPNDVLIGIVLVIAIEAWQVLRDPHFLFNTLHTIAGLIGEEPAHGRRMVVALGDFLRLTLKNGARSFRSLAEELEFMDLYLGIERVRLGDRLMLHYDIEAQATTAEVPYLLLQPLFENAIRHGAGRLAGPCQVVFRAHRDGHRLLLSLENDGAVRAPSSPSAAHGVGLSNTLARLRLHYGNDFTFQYNDRPEGGVRIDLSLPFRKAESGEEQNAHYQSEYAHDPR
jgi:hypothetical protein